MIKFLYLNTDSVQLRFANAWCSISGRKRNEVSLPDGSLRFESGMPGSSQVEMLLQQEEATKGRKSQGHGYMALSVLYLCTGIRIFGKPVFVMHP